MDHVLLLNQEVMLATGIRLPVCSVTATLLKLDVLLSDPVARHRAVALRKACLNGTEVAATYAADLLGDGLILSDGRPDPEVREVVLAAVRGEGGQLGLVSPFTTPEARALADAAANLSNIQALLAQGHAPTLPAPEDNVRGSWTRLVTRQARGGRHPGVLSPLKI